MHVWTDGQTDGETRFFPWYWLWIFSHNNILIYRQYWLYKERYTCWKKQWWSLLFMYYVIFKIEYASCSCSVDYNTSSWHECVRTCFGLSTFIKQYIHNATRHKLCVESYFPKVTKLTSSRGSKLSSWNVKVGFVIVKMSSCFSISLSTSIGMKRST